jgi:hypothetical protein
LVLGAWLSPAEGGVATLVPNEASAPKLVTVVLMEISEDWQTNRTYLSMETH